MAQKDGAVTTLEQLLAQQEEIARQIDQLKTKARNDGLEQIKTIMVQAGLTPRDLMAAFGSQGLAKQRKSASEGGGSAAAKSSGTAGPKSFTKVAQQYRDPETGDGWSGRGLQPRWLKAKIEAGAKLEDFRIK
jgi:DNA-binding protein H-NS